jgi:hypothetical protein
VTVPHRQASVTASSYLITARRKPRKSGDIRATRLKSGVLTASCTG